MNARSCLAVAMGLAFGLEPGTLRAAPPPPRAEVSTDVREAVDGNAAFALDLYRYLGKAEADNLFISPASVSTALAMTYAGARGETAAQMARTLHFTIPPDRLHQAIGALHPPPAGKPRYELHVANALWGQSGYPFRSEFVDLTRKHYGAGLREADFAERTEQARRAINGWVADQTRDKIKDLLPPGSLHSTTRLVLTNAVYFKGTWVRQFGKKDTADRPFFIAPGRSNPVPLMYQAGLFLYFRDADCRVVELPYAGGDISMVAILADQVDGLAGLEKTLDADRLKKYLAGLQEQKVQVYLPRFRMTREAKLKGALSDLGMPLAFSPDKADFAGMSDGPKRLFISQVFHKAFVDVNEEGTEAAAATGVVVRETSVAPRQEVFRADHPFLFLIRDRRTGAVLFLGRVVDPRGS